MRPGDPQQPQGDPRYGGYAQQWTQQQASQQWSQQPPPAAQPWGQSQWAQQPPQPQWAQQPPQPWGRPQWAAQQPPAYHVPRSGRGPLWTLFAVVLAVGLLEAAGGLLSPVLLPSLIGPETADRPVRLVFGLVVVGCAVWTLLRPSLGRIGLVAVSGLATLDNLVGAMVMGIDRLSLFAALAVLLWLVIPAIAFLPPMNRNCPTVSG